MSDAVSQLGENYEFHAFFSACRYDFEGLGWAYGKKAMVLRQITLKSGLVQVAELAPKEIVK